MTRYEVEIEPMLTPGQAARICGVTRETLRRWEVRGLLSVVRTPGNQRRYREAEVRQLLTDGRGRLLPR
jgi:excisionase family DNA binding protein